MTPQSIIQRRIDEAELMRADLLNSALYECVRMEEGHLTSHPSLSIISAEKWSFLIDKLKQILAEINALPQKNT